MNYRNVLLYLPFYVKKFIIFFLNSLPNLRHILDLCVRIDSSSHGHDRLRIPSGRHSLPNKSGRFLAKVLLHLHDNSFLLYPTRHSRYSLSSHRQASGAAR